MAAVAVGRMQAGSRKAAAPGLSNALRAGGRSSTDSRERHRGRNVLIVAQVAFALVLLVSSGLMIRTSFALRSVEPGFTDPASIQTIRISIPGALIAEPDRVARLQQEIVDRLSALPGVTSVGYANVMHMEGLGTSWDAIQREDAPQTGTGSIPPMRVFKGVSPRFFAATGTRLVAGRDYEWADLYGRRRHVIVSENLARELWGSPQQALGKRLRASLPGSPLLVAGSNGRIAWGFTNSYGDYSDLVRVELSADRTQYRGAEGFRPVIRSTEVLRSKSGVTETLQL